MIATLDVPGWGKATLEDDGTWKAADETFAVKLNGDFGPGAGLSVLPYGYGQATEAGFFFKVNPVFAKPLEPLPEGAIS